MYIQDTHHAPNDQSALAKAQSSTFSTGLSKIYGQNGTTDSPRPSVPVVRRRLLFTSFIIQLAHFMRLCIVAAGRAMLARL